ncbi:hypothetical protein NPIL_409041 [Nephila pilipes]|uniref:Uncharacterized protein n=1 Tax=Nephila pilipes TaxID=299642 RepID=A0A8X6UNB2_NEPPI|nr:hypothetical protein NPIL_409041 [Nephila pilipes]
MKLKIVICTIIATVFLSCCFHEAEGFGKLGILKLVKAGLILKALSPKKILLPLPLPIPIPIGIHKESHGHDYGHHDYHHGYNDYHHGFHGHHDYHEPHHGLLVHSTGWRIESIGKWH